MSELSAAALTLAAAGGLVSFASPCVLALVPGYLAFLSGVSVDRLAERRRALVAPTLAFVAGFGLVFTLLGAGLGGASEAFKAERRTLEWAGGAILVALGLLSLLGPRLRLGQREWRPLALGRRRAGRLGGAALTGVAFGVGWTPCIGPILGGILTAAATGASPSTGAILLAAYSAGLGIPFLATGLAFDRAVGALARLRRAGAILGTAAGVGLAAMGVLVATGQLSLITQELARFNYLG